MIMTTLLTAAPMNSGDLATTKGLTSSQDPHLLAEISRLQQAVNRLEQENLDLRIALANTAEHGDCIEAELTETNEKLQTEVCQRMQVELTLQSLLTLISTQRDDLEIILETLVEHGDVLDSQWQQKVSQANLLASSDALTQIANRRRFDEFLETQWQQMTSSQSPLSVLMCDVDFFKQFNDHYGHPAGDACLRQVAAALNSALYHDLDLLARYGGEEFVAILPQTNLSQALTVAQRMQTAVAQLETPHQGSSIAPHLTVSIGLATVCPSDHQSPSLLVNAADRQLYQAKAAGRNQIAHVLLT
jgi:diguanylate cyclase (GGDEF)-like protein